MAKRQKSDSKAAFLPFKTRAQLKVLLHRKAVSARRSGVAAVAPGRRRCWKGADQRFVIGEVATPNHRAPAASLRAYTKTGIDIIRAPTCQVFGDKICQLDIFLMQVLQTHKTLHPIADLK